MKSRYLTLLVTALFLAGAIWSATALAGCLDLYQAGREEYQEVRRESLEGMKLQSAAGMGAAETHALGGQSVNQDYCAWILIPDTRIDYPVVQGDDNEYYLTHTFRRNENPCGCIFADAYDEAFETDNTILYGHNMRDGSMFAGLKKYITPDYQKDNPELWVWVKGRGYIYTIYSCQVRDKEDFSAYRRSFASTQEKVRYLEDMRDHSLYTTGVVPLPDEKILTLSTCYGAQKRLIVQGVMKNG